MQLVAGDSGKLVRAAVGLLPDLSPYTRTEALQVIRKGVIIACLSLCDLSKLEREKKTAIECLNGDAVPQYMRETVAYYDGAEKDVWFNVIDEALKSTSIGSPKVRTSMLMVLTSLIDLH